MDNESNLRDRKRKRIQTKNAYQRVFGTREGQAVLADMRQAFGMDRPAFLPLDQGAGRIAYDTHYAAIRDGQRQVFLHLEAKLRVPTQEGAGRTGRVFAARAESFSAGAES